MRAPNNDPIDTTLYACRQCGAERVYGAGEPDDPNNQPILRCASICGNNPHEYRGMGTGNWEDFARQEGA